MALQAQKYNYQIYIFVIEDKVLSTPPQELIDLLETGWEIIGVSPYGQEIRKIILILRKLI